MSLPVTQYVEDWCGNRIPCAEVRCITCGSAYLVSPYYNICDPCPFCRSTAIKAVFQAASARP